MSNSTTLKTKNELQGSRPISSASWRKIQSSGSSSNQLTKSEAVKSSLKVGAYIRLSPTSDDRDEGSLVSHPQRINQFVDLKNAQSGDSKWGVIIETYVDKDLSGKDMDRPSFQRMLRDIKAGRIDTIIVTELSRLTRKVRDFCELWEFFKSYNVKLISLKESFDTSTPMGELILIQSMSFAQFERQTIVDRIKKGAKARAERGLGNGIVSLGFDLIPNRPNHREVNSHEREIIEMIFRKFLELRKLAPVLAYLNQHGYRTKEFISKDGNRVGGKRWTMASLYYLLTNRAYIGEREINKRNRALRQECLSQDEQYSFAKAQWPALISRELFYNVQRLLEANRKNARPNMHHYYRLTGFIECHECGQNLIGKSSLGQGGKYFYYGHKRRMIAEGDRHLKRCLIENIPACLIEDAVLQRLSLLSEDKKLLARIISASHSEKHSLVEHQRALVNVKEQERRKFENQYHNLLESIADSDSSELRADIKVKAAEVKGKLLASESELLLLKQELAGSKDNLIDVNKALEYLKIFRERFGSQPLSVQREVLGDIMKRIVVKEDVIVLELYIGDSVFLPIDLEDKKNAILAGSTRSESRPDFSLVGAALSWLNHDERRYVESTRSCGEGKRST